MTTVTDAPFELVHAPFAKRRGRLDRMQRHCGPDSPCHTLLQQRLLREAMKRISPGSAALYGKPPPTR